MQALITQATAIAEQLKARGQTLSISESSTGGLLSASLLAVPGASAYYLGGAIVYTRRARALLSGIPTEAMQGIRSASEPYAMLLARTSRERFQGTWALAETGATGPAGNSYGDAAGHCCLAVSGPVEEVITLETGSADRVANMHAFAAAALQLLARAIARGQPGPS
jgi:nicotinamide-nucleotide amidase